MKTCVNKHVLMFLTRQLHQSTCSHVFSPISAHFYPHYIIMVKDLLQYYTVIVLLVLMLVLALVGNYFLHTCSIY